MISLDVVTLSVGETVLVKLRPGRDAAPSQVRDPLSLETIAMVPIERLLDVAGRHRDRNMTGVLGGIVHGRAVGQTAWTAGLVG
jgi:hypothetical protein